MQTFMQRDRNTRNRWRLFMYAATGHETLRHKVYIQTQSVLKSTIEKLALVGAVKSDAQAEADELVTTVGDGILEKIQRQKTLERQFQQERSGQESKAQLDKTSDALKQSTRQLCQNLRDNPNIADNLAKAGHVRQALLNLLTKALHEMQETRQMTSIEDAVEAHQKAEIQVKETVAREKLVSEAVKNLKCDTNTEKWRHAAEMRKKKRTVRELKETLRTTKIETAQRTRLHEKQCDAANENKKLEEQRDLERLEREIQSKIFETDSAKRTHQILVVHLRQAVEKRMGDLEYWKNYAVESRKAKEEYLRNLEADREQSFQRLHEIEGAIKEELSLKHNRESQENIERERENRLASTAEAARRAAIRIQALWRGWKARKLTRPAKSSARQKPKKK